MLRKSDLQGYKIRGVAEKLIATLYADDTTVYLSEKDSYETLINILNKWCVASGAKFNIQKTEIIPLGGREYRTTLTTDRKLNGSSPAIPEQVRIARDGEAVRILGSWPGNKVVTHNAWATVMEKVQKKLDFWDNLKPTMNGRSLIAQVYGRRLTQYLTSAQGMPKKYERELDSMVLDFFWSGAKKHPLNMNTLRRAKEDGGIN
ncbi:hypothetical protein AURDEDRAFT_45648, partial [Auricularia subglabra TFB-10046 SS5]